MKLSRVWAVIALAIAHLGGDAVAHILAWARAWAPWMPQGEARETAERIADEPQKFTADSLAWRLRLSTAERTALRITTVGAFDVSKAERAEERKQKNREAMRIRRAKNSLGRSRGRPKKSPLKNPCTAVKDTVAVHGFSDQARAAQEPPTTESHDDVSDNRACARLISTSDTAVKKYKSRIAASLRPTKAQINFAVEAGYDRAAAINTFEMFHNHHLAIGSYANDWQAMWQAWITKAVDLDTERFNALIGNWGHEKRTAISTAATHELSQTANKPREATIAPEKPARRQLLLHSPEDRALDWPTTTTFFAHAAIPNSRLKQGSAGSHARLQRGSWPHPTMPPCRGRSTTQQRRLRGR
jgi:hypothetical protein